MRRSQLQSAPASLVADLHQALGPDQVLTDPLTLLVQAVDASHYQVNPRVLTRAHSADQVGAVLAAAHRHHQPVTFRSGGTSLSGQAQGAGVLVDVRRAFRSIEILDDGRRVRLGPGLTIGEVNARLVRYGRKLGPDPASEIACTVGGVVANNSSGMVCGTTTNTYRTLESMVVVLASGTIIDTADPGAIEVLRGREPALLEALVQLQEQAGGHRDEITRRWAQKNTMGYGAERAGRLRRPGAGAGPPDDRFGRHPGVHCRGHLRHGAAAGSGQHRHAAVREPGCGHPVVARSGRQRGRGDRVARCGLVAGRTGRSRAR